MGTATYYRFPLVSSLGLGWFPLSLFKFILPSTRVNSNDPIFFLYLILSAPLQSSCLQQVSQRQSNLVLALWLGVFAM